VFFPLWSFPFLLEKKQSKQTTRETTNALPELRERERERDLLNEEEKRSAI